MESCTAYHGTAGAGSRMDHRRYSDSEERKTFGWGGASILRPVGQAGQLPSSGIALDRQSSRQSSYRLASLFAAGMDPRPRTLQKGWGSERCSLQDQTADSVGSDQSRMPCWSSARPRIDGYRLWQRYGSAHKFDGTWAVVCGRHFAPNEGVDGRAAKAAFRRKAGALFAGRCLA